MPKIVRKRSLRSACKWWGKCINEGFNKKNYGVYKRLVTKISYQTKEDWNFIDLKITSDLDGTIKNFEKLGYGVY